MRKLFKKVATMVAAVAMVTAMCTTAFAEDDVFHVAGADGLTGVNWDPSQNEMTAKGDGTYEISFTDIAKGEYEFKVVKGSTWGTEFNLEGDASSGGSNAKVTVEEDGSTVVVTFDGTKASVEVKAGGAAEVPADTTADTAPTTGDTAPLMAVVAVAAVAGAMVVASKKRAVNE